MTTREFWLENRVCLINSIKRIEEVKRKMRETTALVTFINLIGVLLCEYIEQIMYIIPEFIQFFLIKSTKSNGSGYVMRKICSISIVAITLKFMELISSIVLIPLVKLETLNMAIQFYTTDRHMSDNLREHVNDLFTLKSQIYDADGLTGWLAHQNAVFKVAIICISVYILLIGFKLIVDQISHIIFKKKK